MLINAPRLISLHKLPMSSIRETRETLKVWRRKRSVRWSECFGCTAPPPGLGGFLCSAAQVHFLTRNRVVIRIA